MALDDTVVGAHIALAEIKREYDWDWAGAEQESKKAISLNPSSGNAHASYAALLSYLARHDEAVREAQVALRLDPVARYTNNRLGYDFYEREMHDPRAAVPGREATSKTSPQRMNGALAGIQAAVVVNVNQERIRDHKLLCPESDVPGLRVEALE